MPAKAPPDTQGSADRQPVASLPAGDVGSTADIAAALAVAARPFGDLLGAITQDDLLALVRAELGDTAILDGFQPHGPRGNLARAAARSPILHLVSSNTPHAGLQSVLRGLLVGAHNCCKVPAGTPLPELFLFRAGLPPPLAARLQISATLPDEWVACAETVIVFGSDETIEALHGRLRPDQIFIPHGHRVSLAVVLNDPAGASCPAAARAVSLFDQRGCLSPHLIYVRGDAQAYARILAAEMDRFHRHSPRSELTVQEAASIQAVRADWSFRAANDPGQYALWQSEGSTAWTVLYDGADPVFSASPLNRTVYVKPLPPDLRAALMEVRPHLSTIGYWSHRPTDAEWLAAMDLGASRFCPLAAMQHPPVTWHQDGAPPLGALVRWVDLEPG